MLSDKTVLVTGGAGFIGSHVVEEVVNNNAKVIVLDDLSLGTLKNLEKIKSITFVKGSILDTSLLNRIFKDVDIVIHLAASFGHLKSAERPLEDMRINVEGTLNLLDMSVKNNIEKFVYASSSSVYGNLPSIPLKEGDPTIPMTPYAVSKMAGENYCKAFFHTYDLPTVCLRLFNSYGPREYPSKYRGVVANFINDMLLGKSPNITGDGSETRDYTYVKDTVRAFVLASAEKKAVPEVFNVGTGIETSTLELFNAIQAILGTNIEPMLVPFRKWDIKRKGADTSKAKQILKFDSKYSLAEGLKLTIDWFKKEL